MLTLLVLLCHKPNLIYSHVLYFVYNFNSPSVLFCLHLFFVECACVWCNLTTWSIHWNRKHHDGRGLSWCSYPPDAHTDSIVFNLVQMKLIQMYCVPVRRNSNKTYTITRPWGLRFHIWKLIWINAIWFAFQLTPSF